MKPIPPFDEDKAREEVLAYFRKLSPLFKDITYEDLNARDKKYFERCVKNMRKDWSKEWAYRQILKGGHLLESVISDLPEEEQELIRDYLENKIEAAREQVREFEDARNNPDY